MNDAAYTLQHVGTLRAAPDWTMPRHEHPNHELIVVVGGSMQVRWRHAQIDAAPGDVLLYARDEWHEERANPDDPVHSIFLTFDAPLSLGSCRVFDQDRRIRTLAAWLCDERDRNGTAITPVAEAALPTILAEFQRLLAAGEQDDVVRTVVAYIQRHIAQPISVDELAQTVDMSKYHFIRRYRELSGMTPMDHVRRLRVDQAVSLLLSTDWPQKQVADAAGFANAHHMARHFRRYLDRTPSSFRRSS